MTSLPQFEGCQVVEKVRSGPVADVFLATQQPLGRSVLIKALIPSILPSSPFAATLEREARLLAGLDHTNILQLHDFVRQNDRMWLVLEHVDGWPLDELLEKTGALAPAAAAQVALSLARALDHAHNQGIIHRDVQPKNVLVSRRGQVKLTGFSVAVDERMPTAPELLDGGSSFHGPMYMSPEQILGEPPDPRSDLFSLGIVLYQMLSGKQPFAAPDDRSATQRIRHDPPPPLSRTAPQVPPVLERVVQRCLEKMPSDRFQSAAELAHALESTGSELGTGVVQGALRTALERAGLSAEARKSLGEIAPPLTSGRRRPSLFPALRGLLLCFVLAVVGGGVIQYFAWRRAGVPAARGGIGKLELVPRRQGFLRVVADPWAHVFVDGQRFDTTPFARPVPLEAGLHYVKLEHPQAPTERRTVQIVTGETVLLDVKMKLYAPKIDAGEELEQLPETADAGIDAPPSP